MTYYKAIRPNGTDFFSGKVRWAPADEPAVPGSVVRHPWSGYVGPYADSYLSVSTVATDCTGMLWPCRLLEVEPVDEAGQVIKPEAPEPGIMPNKRAAVRWRIVRELDPILALGPQGEYVAALSSRITMLTEKEKDDLGYHHLTSASYGANLESCQSKEAAKKENRSAAWHVASHIAFFARYDGVIPTSYAVQALLVRDLIGQHGLTQEHYDTLTAPWRRAIGPIHPDDKPIDTAIPA